MKGKTASLSDHEKITEALKELNLPATDNKAASEKRF